MKKLEQSARKSVENINQQFSRMSSNFTVQFQNKEGNMLNKSLQTEKLITAEKKKQVQYISQASKEQLEAWKLQMKELRGESNNILSGSSGMISDSKLKKPKEEFNLLTSEIQRRVSWFATGSLFYGLIDGAKEAKDTITGVEFGITEIARVMEDSTFQFEAYRDELLQMGIDYGQTFNDVQDIALRWAQAGYNVADSLDLTETSLLALNSAELDAQNATESLIGIMAQWGATTDDLPLILDKINKTADEFTVTSQDLVDGLLRSSGAARIMNMSIDETIATLTVMKETSGRTGREVGNALNSILSYIQRQSSINLLESLGIEVFADKTTKEFRNVMDIFKDISTNWGSLSKDVKDGFVEAADEAGLFNEELAVALGHQEEWNNLQQRDVSQAAAGVYRRNYFIGLIERMSQAQEVLNSMVDAEGYSLAENARTMGTLEKQYASTAAAAQQLAVTIGDAGIEELLRTTNNFATSGLQGTTALIEKMGLLPPAIASVAAVLTITKKEFQLLRYDQEKGFSIKQIEAFKNALMTVTSTYKQQKQILQTEGIQSPTFWQKATIGANSFKAALYELNLGAKLLSVSSKALGIALSTAFSIGIGLAIGAIVQWVYKLANAQKDAAEQSKSAVQQFKEERSALQELRQSYEDIAKSGDITENSKKRLKEIQDKLLETYKLEADRLDLVNGKYTEQIQLIDESIAKKAKEQMAAMGARADQAKVKMEKQGRSRISARTFSGMEEIESYIPGLELETMYGELGNTARFVNITGTITERKEALEAFINTLQAIPNKSKDLTKTINNLSTEYIKLSKSIEENQKVIDDYEDIKNENDYWNTFSDTISKVNDIMLQMRASNDETGFVKQLDSLKNEMLTTAEAQGRLADFQPKINELFARAAKTTKDVADSTGDYSNATEETAKEVESLLKELGSLNQTIDDLNKGNNLTATQAYEMIDKYPELANSIVKVGDSYKFETSVLETLRKEKIKEQEIALDAEVQKTKTVLEETLRRINAYGLEVDAIKDMQSATNEFYKLRIATTTMSYENFARSGAYNPYGTEEEYLVAQEAGEKILALGELYESIEQKKKLLEDRSYGISNNSGSSGKGTSSRSSENQALKESLNLLSHLKTMDAITTQEEIDRLKDIKSTYARTADEIIDMEERIYNAEKQYKRERLQLSIDWINEKKSFDALSIQEEIAAWNRVKNNQVNNIEAVKEATQNLYDLQKELREQDAEYYKNYISDQQKLMDDLYNKRIKQIEDETEKKKSALEETIKGIEAEKAALEKSEQDRDYAQEVKELQDELAYWQVRTSEDARKKVLDLTYEMAEKQHEHEIELKKEELDNKKQAAEEEINAIEKTAEEEKKKWEEAYKLIEDSFNSHNMDIISMASVTSKKAFQEWVSNYLVPLKSALNSGDLMGVQAISSGLSGSINKLPSHDWGMSDEDYKRFIDSGKRWEMLNAAGYTPSTNEEMYQLNKNNNDLRLKYGRDPSLGEYPKFHNGAETLSYGLAMFKPGELVFPPTLSNNLKELIEVLRPGGVQNAVTNNRREVNIDRLVNIEKNVVNDETDNASFASELKRIILSVK